MHLQMLEEDKRDMQLPPSEEVVQMRDLKMAPSNHRMSLVTDNSEAQPQISTYAAISKLIWGGLGCSSPATIP